MLNELKLVAEHMFVMGVTKQDVIYLATSDANSGLQDINHDNQVRKT